MKIKFDYLVFIGRFQPFHAGHYHVVKEALKQSSNVILVIGSHDKARDSRDPFTTAERIAIIESCFTHHELQRIHFVPQYDHPYNEEKWIAGVQAGVNTVTLRNWSAGPLNMAGIIGERYIEISPGTLKAAQLKDGATVRGVDPPRIDQLLSQGYGVFGRIQDFLEANESTLKEFLDNTTVLLGDMNQMLKGRNREKFFSLIDNLNVIASDVRSVSGKLRDAETRKFFERLDTVLQRAESIDKATLKKFLQEEGVRARIF
jgi:phospholipid/cholesterol/gamma-HCH transport system substrate-binding protein